MRGKILLLTGLAAGYVLGAKAGRERYEQIKRTAEKVWNDPRVKTQVDRVEDFARDKAPEVAEFISDNAKKVVSQVSKVTPGGKSSSSGSGSKSTTKSSSTPAAAQSTPKTSSTGASQK
ncbi:YtxH domain-containing protein [Homoserinimonas hongtaonis]|uniref:YtxH domain-containing protein n=1 Tax=Homoserinimonas hongtaonis TaxID=2079791 RepID=A0A2U1T250_9MICO|nr:YtxH domain-containing protein [Salinibacterium hongtaonis]AWB88182.1 hypothetical protein C2138_00235 [Salinibacterium hongtaonis]PWB97920.1 hypothetical protein DF220_08830 [Salinibacterium hongtaonis]